ncbi:UDP-glucose/GDP-mannose dehydrogenase family protein [Sinimarinibacterium sp. CAU 1509]|uniref:UDP-glucose dehydrogenase family protein n=1 Tax=Sinimarinibacterium sp. CAU 1509 TaxID=2562283 RepID=UPI0010ABFD72|nr:UDP-glucose/GDP-mannose dehydrogenase family protein [Sinimarinibacterium sp. CAU 1509]TJY61941.1 UDP-glucose/GDP-mannose dehydrogenase family protein [Sinimarinibacterium sp. CAU 1509]
MKISVFGSGYVGLVTAACLADTGNSVVCVDVDAARIETLNAGHCPFYEPGVDALLTRNARAGRIRFTTDAAQAVAHGEIIFIAVGTPPQEDGSADLQYVLQVAKTVGQYMTDYRVVCTKSTVPVGTAAKVRAALIEALAARNAQVDFDVVSNPEFLKEGAAVEDFMRPDRIIVGTDSDRALEQMRKLYAPFNRNHDRVMAMDIESAELTKYAANAMLATRISFMNELALLAEKVGADIESVRRGIGSDPRIGFSFLYAGCGYGGSCFPKDVKALIRTGAEQGQDLKVLNAVEAANDVQKTLLFSRLQRHLGSLSGKTIALWGLAFKPNTDDMREAPSRVLMEAIWAAGGQVRAFDPIAMDATRRIYGERPDLLYADSAEHACEGADALVLVTEWAQFRSPDFTVVKRLLRQPAIFDGRNQYDGHVLKALGFHYEGIGRKAD